MAECRAIERFAIHGLHARNRSAILTVRYPTRGGGESVIDMFVKQTPRATGEARRYAQLSTAGVALPRLLFHAELSDGEDLLGFEFLDTIGINFASEDQVCELLTLLARLNTLPPSTRGERPNPPSGRPEAAFTASVRAALHDARSAGYLD